MMEDRNHRMHGSQYVVEVFSRVREGDVSVADLFTENAVISFAGGTVTGRSAIRDFYRHTIHSMHPQPRIEAVLESPPLYVVILDVPTTLGHHRALDLFEVRDEGIRKLEIYARHGQDPSSRGLNDQGQR